MRCERCNAMQRCIKHIAQIYELIPKPEPTLVDEFVTNQVLVPERDKHIIEHHNFMKRRNTRIPRKHGVLPGGEREKQRT